MSTYTLATYIVLLDRYRDQDKEQILDQTY